MRKKNTISDFHITIQLLWVFLWLPITGLAEPAKNLKEITTDIPSGNRETAEIRKFGEALQNHGWQVEWDSDNTLTLIPATTTSPSAKSPDPTPQISTAPSEAMRSNLPSDLSGFKYWNIERDQRGALLFHPVDISALKEQTEAATNIQQTECRIDQFQLASGSLPVDQWSEAQDVAKQWLNTVGATGLQVGRIRKINRIYLVSIVGESAPYPLKHQLAIRASDASVVLIE